MRSVLFFLCLVVAVPAGAVPVIDSVSGRPEWGSQIIVRGRGFGDVQSPFYLADDLEGGAFSPVWASCYDLSVTSENPRHSRSQYSGNLNFRSGFDEGKCQAPSAVVSREWSASYWFYLRPSWSWGTSTYSGTSKFLSNIKVFRLWSPSSINENFVLAITGWDNRMVFNMENIAADARATPFLPGLRGVLVPGRWHHIEFEFVENSALGAADGRFWVSIGTHSARRIDIVTREDFQHLKRVFILGWSNVWGAGENNPDPSDNQPNDFQIDDLAIINSVQKVIVGNAPQFEKCTHREWMRVTKWAQDEIAFSYLVPDDFPRPAYLYVVGPGGISGENISVPVILSEKPSKPKHLRRR